MATAGGPQLDLDTLKEALGDEKFTALKTYVDGLTGQRDAARNESINGRKGKDTAIQKLTERLQAVEEWAGVEPDADLAALPPPKGQVEAAKQFETKLKRMERELKEAGSQRDEALGKFKSSLQRAAIAEAIGGHEFVDREVVESYVEKHLAWEGDDLLFKADDGKLIPVKDGVAGIAKTRPGLLKPTGTGGAGVRTGNAGSGGGGRTMTRAEFEAATPMARMAHAKAGGQVVDA
jgi:hypothetical protein